MPAARTSILAEPLDLPGGHRLHPQASGLRWETLRPPLSPSPSSDLAASLGERLRKPTAGPPLAARRPALVVVPDATRATFVRPMVEAVIRHLGESRVGANDLELLIAGGLHRPPAPGELALLVGESDRRPTIHVHDADDPFLTHLGTTRRGTPVFLPRRLLAARTLVLVGGITPHYFAGWTGGLKGLVPGAAGRPTITANHRLAVDPGQPSGLHRACREGNVRGNPVAQDLAEAASRLPHAPFLVNVVLGRQGEPMAVVTGIATEAHRAGVRIARRAVGVDLPPYALAVVAAGDPGRERDWIQAHKIVRQGAACVADGGSLIAVVSCPDGVGSDTLLDWLLVKETELAAQVSAHYTVHGHTALAIRALSRRLRIILVTRLAPRIVESMGMTRVDSLDDALALVSPSLGRGAAALVLPRAGTLLPRSL